MIAFAYALAIWAAGWWINAKLAHAPNADSRAISLLIPVIFGLTIIAMWEVLVNMLGISGVILPPPSAIAVRFASSLSLLWADFQRPDLREMAGERLALQGGRCQRYGVFPDPREHSGGAKGHERDAA